MTVDNKVTHCVSCNAPLPEEDIEEGFETCIECDLSADNPHNDADDDELAEH